MNTEKRIRNEARLLLSKGNWSKSVAVFFILFAAVLLMLFLQSVLVLGIDIAASPVVESLSAISPEFSLADEESMGSAIVMMLSGTGSLIAIALGFLLIFPLYCGAKRFFYLLSKGEDAGIHEVFYYLAYKLKNVMAFTLRYGLLCAVKLLPCMAPAYLLFAYTFSIEDLSTAVNSLLVVAIFATGIGGLVLWILWTSRQFLSMYLFIENDNLPAGEYAKISVRILNGNLNRSVRKLVFSFGGWFLLGLTGVGLIYFVPYFEAAAATSAKWMIKLDEEVQ